MLCDLSSIVWPFSSHEIISSMAGSRTIEDELRTRKDFLLSRRETIALYTMSCMTRKLLGFVLLPRLSRLFIVLFYSLTSLRLYVNGYVRDAECSYMCIRARLLLYTMLQTID